MTLQRAGLAETLATQRTRVRLLSRVDSHVNFQVYRSTARRVAYVAPVPFVSRVDSRDVLVQLIALSKPTTLQQLGVDPRVLS